MIRVVTQSVVVAIMIQVLVQLVVLVIRLRELMLIRMVLLPVEFVVVQVLVE